MIVDGNKITPESGYKYVSNGRIYAKIVYLGCRDGVSNWHDTNDEPPDTSPIEDSEALNIITGGDGNDAE